MDRDSIEKEVRRLQLEVWNAREIRFQCGVPAIPSVFDPRHVADHCGLFYEERPRLDTDFAGGGEAAGLWRRDRSTILVSTRFAYEVRRFTAAHEIGHFVLHPAVGDRTLHRELPTDGGPRSRDRVEQEADHFAACLLMPRRAVISAFDERFGGRHPLALTEAVAWHLRLDEQVLFSQPAGSLMFARAVASAEHFDRRRFGSLARHFGVSASAMAIRLQELGLVVPYLYAER